MFKKITYRSILYTGLFSVVLFILDRSFAYYLDAKYVDNRCNYSNGDLNDYVQNKSCDTLFIGSSRVQHTIVPELMGDNTLLLAKQRKHLYHAACIIDILHAENKLPKKLLVLNIDLEDLYLQTEERLINDLNSLKYYYHKNELVRELINRKSIFEPFKFLSSTYRHNGEGWKLISYPIEGNCERVPYDGFIPLLPTKNDSLRLARSLLEDFEPFNFKEINPKSLELLSNIQRLCDNANIEFKLINAPFYKFHPELKEASEYLKSYCAKHSIDYCDFNDSKIPGLEQPERWFDNMHLNEDGALIFTEYLSRKLSTNK